MKKIRLMSMFFALVAISSISVFAEMEKVTIVVDNSYPPYMYGSEGKAQGLYPELLKAVFTRMGKDVEVSALPWKTALQYGERGQAAVGGIYKNDERLKIYDYSEPIFTETLVLYVRKGNSFPFRRLSDLKGKKVGVNLAWSYGEGFDKARRENLFTTHSANDNLANFKNLLEGRVDCIVVDQIAASLIIHREKYTDKVEKLNNPVTVNGTYLVFLKSVNKRRIIENVNMTIDEMKKDKTYNRIIDNFVRK